MLGLIYSASLEINKNHLPLKVTQMHRFQRLRKTDPILFS